jgi:hypothetical protein
MAFVNGSFVIPGNLETFVGGKNEKSTKLPVYYPQIDDKNFISKITSKKEFAIHRKHKILDENFTQLDGKYIETQEMQFLPHQKFARSFINPETPYRSALLFHDPGTGKTLSAIAIAEGFKNHIINLRKTGKHSWVYIIAETAAQNRFFDELIGKGLKGEYASEEESSEYFRLQKIAENDRSDAINGRIKELRKLFTSRIKAPKKNGIYKFATFREFQNHTIGRREKEDGKTQVDDEGNIIRMAVSDEIKNLNNSILIIDEAHRTEGNDWMISIRDILARSKNTRIVLMTATPMYHSASEIIELLTLLSNKEIIKGDIFTKDNALKNGAIDVIKEHSRGRILYLRGKDPEKFPQVIQMGEYVPANIKLIETNSAEINNFRMKHTKIIRVPMSDFHYNTYKEFGKNKLSTETRMITDIALPTPKSKIGWYDKKQIGDVHRASDTWKKENKIDVYKDSEGTYRLTGAILKHANIGYYSAKYEKILSDIFAAEGKIILYEELIEGLGINLFTEILIINGYTPITGSVVTGITTVKKESIRCYHCAQEIFKSSHKNMADHECSPAYFAVLIGTGNSKLRQEQILSKYNDLNNINGKDIKIILGSSVIKESIDFKEVLHVMIINYQHNFSSIKQIEGRAARNYSHSRLPPNKRNVKIYKYVSIVDDKHESLEELKYRKEEFAYTNIAKVARAMKEVAVDCVLNRESNIIPDEKNNTADCDFEKCFYECENVDAQVYANNTTINADTFFKHEKYTKQELTDYIRKLFLIDVVYDVDSLINAIHKSSKFPYILDSLIMDVIVEFIQEKKILRNRYGTEGYLITINNYILFQPHGLPEDITIQERRLPSKATERFFVSITNFVEVNIIKSTYSINNLHEIDEQLSLISKRSEVAKVLSEYNKALQTQALETAIEQLYFDKHVQKNRIFSDENMMKILSHFNSFLITDNKLADSEENYNSENTPDTAKKIIGHYFNNKVSCFYNNKWQKCKSSIDYHSAKQMEDADYIVGYMDKSKLGKIVFKLKFTKDQQKDRRKNNKGFVCTQINNKNLLITIAKNIGIKENLISVNINKICDIIEIVLREKQEAEMKKEKPKRYFYDYL